uniref:DUF4201 domain-containing protein n=1 Tax=Chromera velia CCMP2878 TaxID=1169474 RepID=A0A0G4I054_9ALVE|eukprot:Cvel_9866.t1-p1 / transcript=Cvel_9866.t1 / gene=Cvel_9866 / organism=Chromera_velia_CCMP2878 / gene_product=hypothetical protein / transcript_product=hypothetical protein / location=Cvel_scaffold581:50771-58322(-) / protein_length=731 / sequence_SO=supercontig / SO=protein_coding / is_pseudo=false
MEHTKLSNVFSAAYDSTPESFDKALFSNGVSNLDVEIMGYQSLLAHVASVNPEVVEWMLKEKKCNPNLRSAGENDQTPLFAAREDSIGILLSNGADQMALNKDGDTPFTAAIKRRDYEQACEYLKQGMNLAATDWLGNSVLILACLLPADVDQQSAEDTFWQNFFTGLEYEPEWRKGLKKHGHKGNTCLHAAAASKRDWLIRELVSWGADPETVNADGEMPGIDPEVYRDVEMKTGEDEEGNLTGRGMDDPDDLTAFNADEVLGLGEKKETREKLEDPQKEGPTEHQPDNINSILDETAEVDQQERERLEGNENTEKGKDGAGDQEGDTDAQQTSPGEGGTAEEGEEGLKGDLPPLSPTGRGEGSPSAAASAGAAGGEGAEDVERREAEAQADGEGLERPEEGGERGPESAAASTKGDRQMPPGTPNRSEGQRSRSRLALTFGGSEDGEGDVDGASDYYPVHEEQQEEEEDESDPVKVNERKKRQRALEFLKAEARLQAEYAELTTEGEREVQRHEELTKDNERLNKAITLWRQKHLGEAAGGPAPLEKRRLRFLTLTKLFSDLTRERDRSLRLQMDKVSALHNEMENRRDRCENAREVFNSFKEAIQENAVFSRTHKKIPMHVLSVLRSLERAKNAEVEELRGAELALQSRLRKMNDRLNSVNSNALTTDFEKRRIDVEELNQKITALKNTHANFSEYILRGARSLEAFALGHAGMEELEERLATVTVQD